MVSKWNGSTYFKLETRLFSMALRINCIPLIFFRTTALQRSVIRATSNKMVTTADLAKDLVSTLHSTESTSCDTACYACYRLYSVHFYINIQINLYIGFKNMVSEKFRSVVPFRVSHHCVAWSTITAKHWRHNLQVTWLLFNMLSFSFHIISQLILLLNGL